MNEYIELMERTLSTWVKEYPIEWIEQAYKNTVGGPTTNINTAWKCGYEAGKKENSPINICPHCGEYIGEEE